MDVTKVVILAAFGELVQSLSGKERIAVLDTMLSTNDTASRDLANVITATRAVDKPRAERGKFKATGTAIIRGVAFPKTAAAGKNLGWETAQGDTVRTTGSASDGHYNRHLAQAARALGLKVIKGQ